MTVITVLILIAFVSVAMPFSLRLHKSITAWLTVLALNLIIFSLYYAVSGTERDNYIKLNDDTERPNAQRHD